MMASAFPDNWDILMIQEPFLKKNGKTTVNSSWTVEYPDGHFLDHGTRVRSMILVNTNIPTNCWESIKIPGSSDITGIKVTTEAGVFSIFNIYNDCTNNLTTTQLSEFLSAYIPDDNLADDHHMIWGGDFNRHHVIWEELRPDLPHLASSAENVQPLLDLVYRYDMTMALPYNIPTLEASNGGRWTRPDNVWCTRNVVPLYVNCETNPPLRPPHTDHIPITSTLDLVVQRNEPTERRNFRMVDWDNFNKRLSSLLKLSPAPTQLASEEAFQNAVGVLTEAIYNTIGDCVPISHPTPFTKRWWSKELNDLKKKKNKLSNKHYRYRSSPDEPIHAEYKECAREYHQLIEKSRSEHWDEWLETLEDQALWTASKYTSDPPTDYGKTRIPSLSTKLPDGRTKVHSSNESKSEALAASFFPPPPPIPCVPPSVYPKPDDSLKPFSKRQIREAVASLKAFKAPGPDKIPNVVLKKCVETMIDHLHCIFRGIIELEVYPGEWKHLTTVVLRKPGKPSYVTPNSYRPIALMNTLAKLFSTLMADFLTHFCEAHNILPANQFGGRPGRSTSDSMQLMMYHIKHAQRNGKVATALFLDVQGAFPNVVKEVLFHNMKMRGVPTACVRTAEMMLNGRSTCLSFDDYVSEPFGITNGNSQGCPLSMLFYSFYNAPLLSVADSTNRKELMLGFVDDVALLAVGKTYTETHATLKDMMEREGGCFEWAHSHNSSFELSKLAYMDFAHNKPTTEPTDIELISAHTGDTTTVKTRAAYRFLGVQFEPNLRWTAQTASVIHTAAGWSNLVRRLARMSKGISVKLMRRLYIAIVIPRMTYAADVWYTPPYFPTATSKRRQGSVRVLDKMRSIQRQALLTITGAMRTTAGDSLETHTNILPIHLLFLKVCHRAAIRIATHPTTHPLYKIARKAAQRFVKKHKSPLHHLFHATQINPEQIETILPARRRHQYRPRLRIYIEKNKEAAKLAIEAKEDQGVIVYADGSGFEGKAGAAASLWVNGEKVKTLRFHLGSLKDHTVYEAEAVGVILGLHLLQERVVRNKEAIIAIDNQAVIKSLANQQSKPGHYLIDKIHDLVEDLQVTEIRKAQGEVAGYRRGGGGTVNASGGTEWKEWKIKRKCRLIVQWVPGHEDVRGNEEVDEEAKLAAQGFSSWDRHLPLFLRKRAHPNPPLPKSASATKQTYFGNIKQQWAKEWTTSPRYRRMLQIDPTTPSNKFLTNIASLTRAQSSVLLQLRTGHISLRSHLFRIKKADSPGCPHCGEQFHETVWHYLIQCPHYANARHTLTTKLKRLAGSLSYLLSSKDAVNPLLSYIHATARVRTTFGDVSVKVVPAPAA